MNLAIIIGVSDYQYVDKLPGCINDAKAFKYLLDASDKYTETLYIAENTESKIVKQKISSFVKKYESDNIEEVLFYFTGHGLFDENNFYYVLSDFKLETKNQTALQNSELDALLKSLSANVTIKIVDACQSGTRYVKNPEVFSKYLHEAQREFNKCYFMFSSQNDQYSYQSEKISDFTHAFLTSCIARPDQDIRYKDILIDWTLRAKSFKNAI